MGQNQNFKVEIGMRKKVCRTTSFSYLQNKIRNYCLIKLFKNSKMTRKKQDPNYHFNKKKAYFMKIS